MRWMIWPRQYGKTYQVTRWFAADPARRMILTENEQLARHRRRELEDGGVPDGFTEAAWRRHLRQRVISFRTWNNTRRDAAPFRGEIAVDGLEYMLPYLFGGDVAVVTGAGVNDEPEPAQARLADTHHERMAALLRVSTDEARRL